MSTYHIKQFEKKRKRMALLGWIVNITVVAILAIFGTAFMAGVLHI